MFLELYSFRRQCENEGASIVKGCTNFGKEIQVWGGITNH
jgi:hypothetical protein